MGSPRATVDDTRTGPITHDVVDALARGRHHLVAEEWAAGAELPRDSAAKPNPQTPWHPTLPVAFDEHRAVVHEKRVLDEVLAADVADR
jgi:hypothetical protein